MTGWTSGYAVLITSAQAQRRARTPGEAMILPRRQQAILDQMERALGAADPQLRSSYAAFAPAGRGSVLSRGRGDSYSPGPLPTLLGLVILLALGFLAFGINDVGGGCPSAVWHGVCAATAGRG